MSADAGCHTLPVDTAGELGRGSLARRRVCTGVAENMQTATKWTRFITELLISSFHFQLDFKIGLLCFDLSQEMVSNDTQTIVNEGSAEIIADSAVFYNKIQEFNRDLSIAAITCWSHMFLSECSTKNKKKNDGQDEQNASEPEELVLMAGQELESGTAGMTNQQKRRHLQLKYLKQQSQTTDFKKVNLQSAELKGKSFSILEALSATGLRSLRYAKEISNVGKIVSNDLDSAAVAAISRNAEHNGVQHIIQANQGDASQVLYAALGRKEKYDVIDLDPYGSAMPFLDGAVQAVSDGGLLCVTCTDMAVLAGSQPQTCFSKYGGINLPNVEYTHEMVSVL